MLCAVIQNCTCLLLLQAEDVWQCLPEGTLETGHDIQLHFDAFLGY